MQARHWSPLLSTEKIAQMGQRGAGSQFVRRFSAVAIGVYPHLEFSALSFGAPSRHGDISNAVRQYWAEGKR